MKLKKLIYILLVLSMIPMSTMAASGYPTLPNSLKNKLISTFRINPSGKTMLYEKVNIYGDFDTWMVGWFDDKSKIVTGITDDKDIVYYNIANYDGSAPSFTNHTISPAAGERIALDFLTSIMPEAELKLINSGAYEYTFVDSYKGISILGREATVVVDKSSGSIVYYKGFGQTDCGFKTISSLVTEDAAFDIFYQNIGLELIYNTVFDDVARTKAVRPMYVLNRSDYWAVDAQSGRVRDISMHDYNYYYNDEFFDPRYYYDNNIHTEEKLFSPDGSVSASGYDMSNILDLSGLGLSNGYCAKIVPGIIKYYSDGDGSENTRPALRLDIVPSSHAIDIYKFCEKFDSGNPEWFNSLDCSSSILFARAYVDARSGQLLDFETVKNPREAVGNASELPFDVVDRFVKKVAAGENIKFYGMQPTGDGKYHISYARYEDGIRVVGEGVSLIYDTQTATVTDYTLSISDTQFFSPSLMKSHKEMKEFAEKEISLGLYYVDKDSKTKFIVYDATDRNIAFDPITGDRIDRLGAENSPVIASCSVGSSTYTLSGNPFVAPPPVVASGNLYIPVSFMTTALGYEITVNDDEVTLSNGKDKVTLSVDSNICQINGAPLALDVPPIVISENIYMSAPTLKSLSGAFVSWDYNTNKIHIVR